jgi:phosphoribosylamine-glycine ligase
MGSGNCSIKVGCAENLIISIPDDAPILLKAFSEATDKLAAKHQGLFVMDANTILKDGDLYFLEFCTRWGFDSTQTEMEMAGGVSNFFEAVANGRNPFEKKYGVAVRGLNMNTDEKGALTPNIQMRWDKEEEEHIFPFDVSKDENGKYIHNAYEYELLSVFTGSSDDCQYAIMKAYEALGSFSFNEMYYRSYDDFICREYDGNILDRLDAIQDLINSPEVE